MGNDIWFIVQTNPNCEKKAVGEIRREGFGAYLPKFARTKRHHRTKEISVVRKPLMAGYVFMRFKGPANWYALRQCQGVKGVLYFDGKPYAVQREVIAAIMRAQRSMSNDDKETRSVRREMRQGRARSVEDARKAISTKRFGKGMQVSAPMGKAERMMARVLAVTKRGTVRAITTTMGREVEVEFSDLDSLEILDEGARAA